MYYEKCITRTAKILNDLRDKYPRLSGSFFAKNILQFLGVDDKMLNPSRQKIISQHKYKILHQTLGKFNTKKFLIRLLNTGN